MFCKSYRGKTGRGRLFGPSLPPPPPPSWIAFKITRAKRLVFALKAEDLSISFKEWWFHKFKYQSNMSRRSYSFQWFSVFCSIRCRILNHCKINGINNTWLVKIMPVIKQFHLGWSKIKSATYPLYSLYLWCFAQIWYHLHNLINMKNTLGRVLLLVKLQAKACNFTKSNIPPWVFFTFLNGANGIKSLIVSCLTRKPLSLSRLISLSFRGTCQL